MIILKFDYFSFFKKLKSFITFTLLLSCNCFSQILTIYTENTPPLNFVNSSGELAGQALEIVQEIQSRLKEKSKIVVVPWALGYQRTLEKENTMIFSTTRTEQREKLFKWVGPITSKDWVFIARKGSGIVIHQLDDAKKIKKLGGYRLDAKTATLLSEGFKNIEEADNDLDNLRKLQNKRIDLWFTGDSDARYLAQKEGIPFERDFELVYVYKTVDQYLAFSLTTSDEIVKKWEDTFTSLLKDGTLKKIKDKWK